MTSPPIEPLPRAVQQLVHELQVHQIELDNARARYFDLYDLAPVGYVTVGASGLILEANLTVATLLGVARSALVRRPLHAFVAEEDQDNFYLLCRQLRETCAPQSCEVRMNRPGGPPLWVHLMATATTDGAGVFTLRMVLGDISALKSLERQLKHLAEGYCLAPPMPAQDLPGWATAWWPKSAIDPVTAS